MSDTATCAKCGSSEIVPRARILDHADYNIPVDLQVGVDRNPDAWVFKNVVKSGLYGRVCGVCGYTEIYAAHPRTVYNAYLEVRGEPDPPAEPEQPE